MRVHGARRCVVTLILAVSMAGAAPGRAVVESLTGSSRLLLIFSPDGDGPLSRRTEDALAASRCEVEDRDLIVIRLPESATPTADGRTLLREEAADLRQRYRVSADEFLIVLIGKDGGEKFRSDRPDVLPDIFRLIDTMPMRRAEMRSAPVACDR